MVKNVSGRETQYTFRMETRGKCLIIRAVMFWKSFNRSVCVLGRYKVGGKCGKNVNTFKMELEIDCLMVLHARVGP